MLEEAFSMPVGVLDHTGSQIFKLIYFLSSGNRTPGSRFYSELLDTLADSLCIQQLVLKRRSKR